MADLMPIVITKMHRADHGDLEARVSVNGDTVVVSRQGGSWLIPLPTGGWRQVLPAYAVRLAERARAFERSEATGGSVRGVRQNPQDDPTHQTATAP